MKRASPMIACLLTFLTVGATSAATVVRGPSPLPDLIQDTSCGFLVNVTFPVNDQYAISRYDANGDLVKVILQGRLVVTFANAATGEAITANISGPSIFYPDGSGVLLGRIGGPLPGVAGLFLFSGRIDTVTGEAHGHLSADVCAILAP
jgi:hypothetical protein